MRTLDPCSAVPEPARIAALQQSHLLDRSAEPTFDRVTRLAARMLRAPVALMSVVAADRVFFKSSVGLPEPLATEREVPLSRSFCQLVAAAGEPMLISDARAQRFLEDDWAVRELGVVAYAGVPLIMPAGYVVGALCVIDNQVRAWTDEDVAQLWDLAAVIWTELQLRYHIAEQKRLEAQFLQIQKIESLGRLASSIAHDFNNLLTAISGYTDLAQRNLPLESAARADLQGIHKVVQHASLLTRQLLAFARPQIFEPCALNLNDLILDMDGLLRRLVGEDIELVILPALRLGLIRADPGQIGQVLVNLVVNARDAMPNGGTLTMKTSSITLQPDLYDQVGLTAGPYVLLSVTDTGMGMPADVLARAFEPFYTTKEFGRGTGLGLATCYAIVRQHGGHIWIASTPGQGTTVNLYLPLAGDATGQHLCDETDTAPRGSETILLAEDEPMVCAMLARTLRGLGYTVFEASNGDDALRMAQEYAGTIDLLLADMVMPEMGGQVLATRVVAGRPNISVLLTSGYTDIVAVHQETIGCHVAFLPKPFFPVALAHKLRELLDRDRGCQAKRTKNKE